jgi:hypothetical protein
MGYNIRLESLDDLQLGELNDKIATYIRIAIKLRFISSFLYEPAYHESYFLNVTVYYSNGKTDYSRLLNVKRLMVSYHELLPNSEFKASVRGVPVQSDPKLLNVLNLATSDGFTSGGMIYAYILENEERYLTPHGTDCTIHIFIFGDIMLRLVLNRTTCPKSLGSIEIISTLQI